MVGENRRLRIVALFVTTLWLGGCVVDTQPCSPTGYPMDYPLALVLTFLLIVVVALANLIADIAYTVVDPRIEYA